MVRDYLRETEYALDRIYFDYLGGRYQGRGIMRWKPDDGFRIEAFLERHGASLPRRVEFGKVRITNKSDVRSIRMRLGQSVWALAPNVPLNDHLELLMGNRLAVNVNRVLFSQAGPDHKQPNWYGSAIYGTKSKLLLPDNVDSEVRVKGQRVSSGSTAAGIWYEDDQKQRIVGRWIEGNLLEIHWKLSNSLWSRTHNWRWPEAAQDALSILFGETIWLLQREIQREGRRYVEVRRRRGLASLGHFAPFDDDHLDKSVFAHLAEFFTRDEPHADVCRRIFSQMVEASRQQSWQATELLLSTICEAALRTVYEHPFQEGGGSWNADKNIERFRRDYLSDKWKKVCDRVIEVRKRLRHRNAHPDWLDGAGGSLSEERLAESLDDMVFLSRFYGYMILSLAGFKNLEPVFPRPHNEWKPIMTVERSNASAGGE